MKNINNKTPHNLAQRTQIHVTPQFGRIIGLAGWAHSHNRRDYWSENLTVRDNLEDISVDGIIRLNLITKK